MPSCSLPARPLHACPETCCAARRVLRTLRGALSSPLSLRALPQSALPRWSEICCSRRLLLWALCWSGSPGLPSRALPQDSLPPRIQIPRSPQRSQRLLRVVPSYRFQDDCAPHADTRCHYSPPRTNDDEKKNDEKTRNEKKNDENTRSGYHGPCESPSPLPDQSSRFASALGSSPRSRFDLRLERRMRRPFVPSHHCHEASLACSPLRGRAQHHQSHDHDEASHNDDCRPDDSPQPVQHS